MTDHMGNTCAYHYPHTKFYENWSLRLAKVYLFGWQATSIYPYIVTYIHPYRERDNENLSGPSSIAGSPQKQNKTKQN